MPFHDNGVRRDWTRRTLIAQSSNPEKKMPAQPKKPLYDPAANPYPKMVYPGDTAPGAGKIVNSKEEEEAFLASLKPADDDGGKKKKAKD